MEIERKETGEQFLYLDSELNHGQSDTKPVGWLAKTAVKVELPWLVILLLTHRQPPAFLMPSHTLTLK